MPHRFNKDDYLKMLQEKLTAPATPPVSQQTSSTPIDEHEALKQYLKRRNGKSKAGLGFEVGG